MRTILLALDVLRPVMLAAGALRQAEQYPRDAHHGCRLVCSFCALPLLPLPSAASDPIQPGMATQIYQ